MNCYKCKKKLDLLNNKIGFKEYCPHCLTDIHVCKNCKFYIPGKPNDCYIPDIDKVLDKEKNNFCEEFSIKTNFKSQSYKSKKDIEKSIFKDSDDNDDNTTDFNSLFKD